MQARAPNVYRLATLWVFDAPVDEVWEAIVHPEDWPRWWAGAESVVPLAQGDASGVGASQHFIWKGRLPYRLCFTSLVTVVDTKRLLEGRVSGQLEGIGRWRFAEEEGVTTLHHEWQVRTTRLWMNLVAPVARPAFCRNHEALMRDGAEGLARRLGALLLRAEHHSC